MLNKNLRPMAIRRTRDELHARKRRKGELHPLLYWLSIGAGICLFSIAMLSIMYAPYLINEFLQELK